MVSSRKIKLTVEKSDKEFLKAKHSHPDKALN